MTEETTNRPNKSQDPASQKVGLERSVKMIRRTLSISSIFLAFTIVDSIAQYQEFRAWQILADATGILVALIILIVSLYLHTKEKPEQAYNLIPFVILFGYAPGDLFLEGVTLYNLVSGILLFALAFLILSPQNLAHWLRMVVLYIALVVSFGILNIFPRFDISQSPSWQISLPIFTAVLVILLGWQLIRSIQIRTIQTRILVILISLGLIPTVIATAASTVISFNRDIRQAEDYLSAISTVKDQQISTWFNQVQKDVDSIQEDQTFIENLNFLINFTPTESYRDQLIGELRQSIQDTRFNTGRFTTLSLVSLDGEVLISTDQELEGTFIRNDQALIFGKSETFRTPLTINQDTGKPETRIYQPLANNDDVILAVLIGEIITENIVQTISDPTLLGETGESYLVSVYNYLLTPLRNTEGITPGSASSISSQAIRSTIQDRGSRTLRGENYQSQAVIGSYKWNPELQTVLVIEQTESEAFQTIRLNLIINAVIGIAVLAVTVTIAFSTARNFSEPIKTISSSATRVRAGELEQIEPLDREDEIGDLSKSLSEMTGQLIRTTANLEKTVSERTRVLERRAKYLETTSQISGVLTSIYDVDDLLNTVAHLISENFGFYHVGVFILDEKQEFAVLRAANSEGGWRMLAREHKLKVGEQGIVGFVTGSGQSRIQQQVAGDDSVHFKNPDLPHTRSELALPLKVGEVIFGALDVQSTEEQAFTEEDVSVLQVLADSVSVAIQNTRLVQQLQGSLETERRIYGELTREAWTSLLKRKSSSPAFRSDGFSTQTTTTPLSPIGRQAFSQGKSVIPDFDTDRNVYPIAVPVRVRGGVTVAVIETIKLQSAGPWTKEEINILESVSEDLGIALENARLVEETQRKAQRDRIAAELASKIWASSDVDNILQTAVRELGSALQVSRGSIQLTMPEESPDEKKPDGVNRS